MSDDKKRFTKKIAPFCVLAAGILWGCIGLFIRTLNGAGLYALEIVALRSVVTCIFMAVVVAVYNRSLFQIRLKDLWCFIGTGICSVVFFNACYFQAISLTSLSIAAVLLYTAPTFVMIMSYFLFKEQFTARKGIALLLTFLGCVLVTGVVTAPGTITGMGILVGLGAGFGYALYSIFSRFCINRGYHSMTITFYTFLFASIGTFFLADISSICTTISQSPTVLGYGVALGIISTVIPYLLYTFSLTYVENGKASIIASIEPVTATLLGILIFQEKADFFGIVGMLLVLAGLTIS